MIRLSIILLGLLSGCGGADHAEGKMIDLEKRVAILEAAASTPAGPQFVLWHRTQRNCPANQLCGRTPDFPESSHASKPACITEIGSRAASLGAALVFTDPGWLRFPDREEFFSCLPVGVDPRIPPR